MHQSLMPSCSSAGMLSGQSRRAACSDSGCESCRDISDNVHFTHISNVKRAKILPDCTPMDQKKKRLHNSGACVSLEKKACIDMFDTWSSNEQVDFLCHILSRMSHFQQSQVNNLLEPLLKRDFIVAFRSHGVPHLAELILSQLDGLSLLSVELVSRGWQWSVAKHQLWRRLIARRIATDPVWHGLAERRGWLELVHLADPSLLPTALEQRRVAMGLRQKLSDFPLLTDNTCHDDVLEGHTGSVLCLQYIGNLLISGSSDTSVRLWDLSTGRCLNVITHHAEAVLHLRFRNNVLVTCSKVTELILSQLDGLSLLSVELVSRGWQWSVAKHQLWRRLIARRIATDPVWHGLAERRGWLELVHLADPSLLPTALEQRRVAMGLRQKLSDFPLLTDNTCHDDVKSHMETDPKPKCPVCSSHIGNNNSSTKHSRSIPQTSELPLAKSRIVRDNHSAADAADASSLLSTSNFSDYRDISCRRSHASASFTLDTDRSDNTSPEAIMFAHRFYKQLYPRIIKEIKRVEDNWSRGNYHLTRIPCRSDEKIVSGLRDDTIKVWRRLDNNSSRPNQTRSARPAREAGVAAAAAAHDPDHAVVEGRPAPDANGMPGAESGTEGYSTDAGSDGYRCTQDRSIAVWDMGPWPRDVQLRQVLVGHRAAVNVVDFDDKYIVSASGDRTIKVWDTDTCAYVRTLSGHRRGIACLQYRDRLVFDDFQIVSSSHDDTILIWDFVRPSAGSEERDDGFDDGIHTVLASHTNNCLDLPSSTSQSQPVPTSSHPQLHESSVAPTQPPACNSLVPFPTQMGLSSSNESPQSNVNCVDLQTELPAMPGAVALSRSLLPTSGGSGSSSIDLWRAAASTANNGGTTGRQNVY
ncbi:hypothetical protein AHF37_05906 [Paragonimus kellicotti]|nr:hypothetical protein AHF37_05906 [Paragonimus kellicotti]